MWHMMMKITCDTGDHRDDADDGQSWWRVSPKVFGGDREMGQLEVFSIEMSRATKWGGSCLASYRWAGGALIKG